MSNMEQRTTFCTAVTNTISIIFLALLAFTSNLSIPSFGREENNVDDATLVLSGRIIV
jgi:hypothetical protein